MEHKIDQEVLDELIAMIENHFGNEMRKPEDASVEEAAESPEAQISEGPEMPNEDDEDMRKLMEHYSRG